VCEAQGTNPKGLSMAEAQARLERFGINEAVREHVVTWYERLIANLRNPLVLLLVVLAVLSAFTGDIRGTIVMSVMIVLSVVIRFFQESRADAAAADLRAMVTTTATVIRDGDRQEVPLTTIVPGDIVVLSAGDMVPADMRLVTAKDLYVVQAALTGESMPVEKSAAPETRDLTEPLEASNLCFMGTNVQIGAATAVVLYTGGDTYFGSLARSAAEQTVRTSFDIGISRFTMLMISFMAVMVPAVLIINGLTKHDWLQAFLFALAVAVGLTPEMLPMIVTVNLSQGAIAMGKRKVIVKHLDSIQNFGAMDVLCTDKTGTITLGKVILEHHYDIHGDESEKVLDYSYLNSYYQTGLKNLLDVAVLSHAEVQRRLDIEHAYRKVDEIPFDFERRRMSVIVEGPDQRHILICKGAPEEVQSLCDSVEEDGKVIPMDDKHRRMTLDLVERLNEDGFRVLALAYCTEPRGKEMYSIEDEASLTMLGALAFLDPPKETAPEALREMDHLGVQIKILTGDNDTVTRKICREVGLSGENVLLGADIERMSEGELAAAAEKTVVFARLSPHHKAAIVHALQHRGHVVGFMGDGINDAPALRAADVGISVDSAVDIAKESSDLILLETSLLVLNDGIIEGRRVFANILKYVKMAASSNFGNMFSVVGASAFLPFLPMLPLQVLTNNLLYDFSQTTIPTDNVDPEWLTRPRKWTLREIRRFVVLIGPISSIFDYATFFMMLNLFHAAANPSLFQTGWFVESLMTQSLIIHVIRTNKLPFLQSHASTAVSVASLLVVGAGIYLTVSPLAYAWGFTRLPGMYWPLVFAMLVAYVLLTQVVKTWFVRRFGG
jgi:Mg2+-importing ATPase